MKYFWVRHKETGEVTIARYTEGRGVWHHFGRELEEIGLIGYTILGAIEHLVADERPRHGHARKAVTGVLTLSDKQLNVGGTTTATVSFKDKAGESVILPEGNKPAWAVDQVALLDMTVADDGLSAELTAKGVGLATITVTAEGDPTPGVDTITVTGTIDIVDEASSGELTFS